MILAWSRPAERDLVGILDFIADDDPASALATIERIEACARRWPPE